MDLRSKEYNTDWIFASGAEVCVANHRDWFTTYTRFQTSINMGINSREGARTEVVGIGRVLLQTKAHPKKTGQGSQGTILLHDVLHVPESRCNILSPVTYYGVVMDFSIGVGKVTDPKTGACCGILDCPRLPRLRLKGQSAKQTSLDQNVVYIIRASWPANEQARWEAFKAKPEPKVMFAKPELKNPPYNAEEKNWLKNHYRNEYHFLHQHGLKIFEEEDRAEGREIARAIMEDDQNTEERDDDSPGGDEYEANSFLRDLEDDPTSHAADYHFSEQELDWIAEHYRHSSNFLFSYGLKFYDSADCKEGKAIIEQLMNG